ncbi:hypothetical protein DFH08DRAFT_169117 [Mycena albidolilacea]|uniref:Uncharacterized protein n=1 Tax=Mycena albidolilacea TaxID=1033008 RepID=A0AAD7F358_9AGAR|nr:hypothetical protein DFH08DRAFT_169117 [Mycena albidolilacea]
MTVASGITEISGLMKTYGMGIPSLKRVQPEGTAVSFWDYCGLQLNPAGCLKMEHAPVSVSKCNGRVLKELESERTTAQFSSYHIRDHESRHSLGPSPSKNRKIDSVQTTKCRNCGELYDEDKNTKRVCRWHDIDGKPVPAELSSHMQLFEDTPAIGRVGTATKTAISYTVKTRASRRRMKVLMRIERFSGHAADGTRRRAGAALKRRTYLLG